MEALKILLILLLVADVIMGIWMCYGAFSSNVKIRRWLGWG